jgi:TPP-dependent pyruvate/acetoin dehydrogenase alpha subunit
VHRNGWTQSVKRENEYATETLVGRAAGYGMPGISVDGGDIEAMFAASREAIERARSGGGPTLIDAHCVRFLPNTSNDDDTRYRDRGELESNFATRVPEAFAAAVDAENTQVAQDAADWAEAQPLGDPSTVGEHAYA